MKRKQLLDAVCVFLDRLTSELNSGWLHLRFVVGEVTTEQALLAVLWFSPANQHFTISPLLHAHLSPPHEVFDSPEQTARNHTLDPKLGPSFLSRSQSKWSLLLRSLTLQTRDTSLQCNSSEKIRVKFRLVPTRKESYRRTLLSSDTKSRAVAARFPFRPISYSSDGVDEQMSEELREHNRLRGCMSVVQ